VQTLVTELENEFKIKFVRGTDGCPWISIAETMAEDWGWPLCVKLILYCYGGMNDMCNGLDPTPDTPETILSST